MIEGNAVLRLTAVAAALTLMVGCIGNGRPGAALDDETLVQPEPGVVLQASRGALRGEVVDDAGLPVPTARAALVGTDWFGDVDERGGFLFLNVTPGDHLLRVEASAYLAHEGPITIGAGNITETTVTLLPDEGRGAGYRPHTHDHWAGRTEHVLLDADVELRQENSDVPRPHPAVGQYTQNYGMNYESSSSVYRIPVAAGDANPNLVFPGAREVLVTLSWTAQQCTLDRLGLKYATPASSNLVTLAPQASGGTFRIPVGSGEWDSGHQRVTFWDFFVHPANHVGSVGNWKPGLLLGRIHAKIVAVKGDEVPKEPAHEDFWGGKDALVLRAREDPAYVTGTSLPRRDFQLAHGVIVPPGTQLLRLQLWWTFAAANGTQPAGDYILTWRSGDQPRDAPITQQQTAPEKSRTGQHVVYDLALKPSQTDAFYQKRSTWRWAPVLKDHQDKEFHVDLARQRTYFLEVTAFRDPVFSPET